MDESSLPGEGGDLFQAGACLLKQIVSIGCKLIPDAGTACPIARRSTSLTTGGVRCGKSIRAMFQGSPDTTETAWAKLCSQTFERTIYPTSRYGKSSGLRSAKFALSWLHGLKSQQGRQEICSSKSWMSMLSGSSESAKSITSIASRLAQDHTGTSPCRWMEWTTEKLQFQG